ncbi:uncharacterized protein EI90DRAFT_3089524 [Cantharellus anzutake]|uniref:uncharacterized protein n=1 Tax=Cantharellus anzutake TaxID=1750568 RepID=UPI00190810E5|nr:uncharacterized protein EI90DRAFT_3089524 [Cantharellus anzutake]KAF8314820.1 hypothetical protein EI90DRAFT_3089524 [Cantharellus anzutake]
MSEDNDEFVLPGLDAVAIQPSPIQSQQTLSTPLLQCCELLVRNLPAVSPESAEAHLRKVVADLQTRYANFIKVAVSRSSTRGKPVDYAYLRLDASMPESVKQARSLKKWIKPLEEMGFPVVWSPMFGLDNRRVITLKYDSDYGNPKEWEDRVMHAIEAIDIGVHYVSLHGAFTSALLHSEADVALLVDTGLTVGRKTYRVKAKACVQPFWPYAGAVVGLARYTENFAQQLAGIVQARFPNHYLASTLELGNNVLVFYVKDWDTISEITNNPLFFTEYLASFGADISPPKLLYHLNEKGFFVPRSTVATVNGPAYKMSRAYDQLAEHLLQALIMVASAYRVILCLAEQMEQILDIVNTLSVVAHTQTHAIAAVNTAVAAMVCAIGGQMEISGVREEISLLIRERDSAESDAEKEALTNKIMILHKTIQSRSDACSANLKALEDLQMGLSMAVDSTAPQTMSAQAEDTGTYSQDLEGFEVDGLSVGNRYRADT